MLRLSQRLCKHLNWCRIWTCSEIKKRGSQSSPSVNISSTKTICAGHKKTASSHTAVISIPCHRNTSAKMWQSSPWTICSPPTKKESRLPYTEYPIRKKTWSSMLFTIVFLGPPGVGKTHLVSALGMVAARYRFSTYYIDCHALIEQLKKVHCEIVCRISSKPWASTKCLSLTRLAISRWISGGKAILSVHSWSL